MSQKAKIKKGRPPILGDEATVAIVRISGEQDELFRKAARKEGKSKSEWMREVLFREAQAA